MLKLIKQIKASKAFKEWNHPEVYLCSVFILDNQVQFDFYSKKTKLVTSFRIENGSVSVLGKDEKVFQKEKKDLEEVKLNEIKINLPKAKEIIEKLMQEKYKKETKTKEIVILQKINNKIIWNISVITSSFNIINIKIDGFSGEVLEDSISPVLSFKEK